MGIAKKIRDSLRNASLIRRVADEAAELRRDGQGDVYDLSIGNPTIEPPSALYQSLRRLLNDPPEGAHRYMSNNGYLETRAAVATRLCDEFGLPFTPRHISMTVGAAGAVNMALKALLDPGDEVIIFAPFFVEYEFYISNHGANTVIVETDDDFQMNLDALAAALTPRTKVILLNTPNNPTGVVYTAERLQALSALLEEHNKTHDTTVYIVNDSPYRKMVYTPEAAPEPFSFYPHSILATSFSKDLAIPGERLGYLAIGPECEGASEIFEALAFVSRILGFVNAPALMQRVLPDLLDVTIELDWYRRKRQTLLDALREFGYEFVEPQGAFYIYPKAPGGDDLGFYQELKSRRVMVVPGSGFGTPGYFRIAYCVHDDIIHHALPIFQDVI